MSRKHTPWIALAVALTIAVPLALAGPLGGSSGGSGPANKTSAAGSGVEMLPPDFADGDQGTTILTTSLKASKPTDLLLTVSLECSLWTEVSSTTIQDHVMGLGPVARAEAQVVVWVELDGVPVKVASDDPDGRIVFCERVHEQEISDMNNSTGDWTLRQYQKTRSANAFTWASLDVGSGVHTLTVKAEIESFNTEGSYAEGAVGKRTLIVEPTRFANGATI